MIESTVLNLEALGNTILVHSNLNSNLFEVNNTLDGQSNNGCGCPIKPIDPLNSTQYSEFYYQSSEIDLFSNQIVVNNYDESESRFLLKTSDPFIQISQGVNLENINFSENSNSIRDREINSEFGNSSTSVGEEESLIQLESPFQIKQAVGIFDSQGRVIGIREGGVTTVQVEYDLSGNVTRFIFPVQNFTLDLSYNSATGLLTATDSFGSFYQGILDPITGNVSQKSVNLAPSINNGAISCIGAALGLFGATGFALINCGRGTLETCLFSLGLMSAAAIKFAQKCPPGPPIIV